MPVRGKRGRAVTKIFRFQGRQAGWGGGGYFTKGGAWSLVQVHVHGRYRSEHQRHRLLTKPGTIPTPGCPCYHTPPPPAPSQPLHYALGSETRAWNDYRPCASAQQHLSEYSQSRDLRASTLTVPYTLMDFHALTHAREHRYMHSHLCTDTSIHTHAHTSSSETIPYTLIQPHA